MFTSRDGTSPIDRRRRERVVELLDKNAEPYSAASDSIGPLVGASNTSTTFAGKIENGTGGLTIEKVGTGTLTLAGINNTYAGTLKVNSAFFANGADILIANGAILDLNYSATEVIRSLYLGGMPQAPGIYGVGASGASYFSGAGKLSVMLLGPPLAVSGDYNNDG